MKRYSSGVKPTGRSFVKYEFRLCERFSICATWRSDLLQVVLREVASSIHETIKAWK